MGELRNVQEALQQSAKPPVAEDGESSSSSPNKILFPHLSIVISQALGGSKTYPQEHTGFEKSVRLG